MVSCSLNPRNQGFELHPWTSQTLVFIPDISFAALSRQIEDDILIFYLYQYHLVSHCFIFLISFLLLHPAVLLLSEGSINETPVRPYCWMRERQNELEISPEIYSVKHAQLPVIISTLRVTLLLYFITVCEKKTCKRISITYRHGRIHTQPSMILRLGCITPSLIESSSPVMSECEALYVLFNMPSLPVSSSDQRHERRRVKLHTLKLSLKPFDRIFRDKMNTTAVVSSFVKVYIAFSCKNT